MKQTVELVKMYVLLAKHVALVFVEQYKPMNQTVELVEVYVLLVKHVVLVFVNQY